MLIANTSFVSLSQAFCLPYYLYGYNGEFVHFPKNSEYCVDSADGKITIFTDRFGGRVIPSNSIEKGELLHFGESQLFGFDVSGSPGSHDLNSMFPNHKLVFYGGPNNGPFETINYLKLISEHKEFKEIVVGFNYGTDIFRIMPNWDPSKFVALDSEDLTFYLENPFLFEIKLALDMFTGGGFTFRRPDVAALQKLYLDLDLTIKNQRLNKFFVDLKDLTQAKKIKLSLIIFPPYWGFEFSTSGDLMENNLIKGSFYSFACNFIKRFYFIDDVIVAWPRELTAGLLTSDQRHYAYDRLTYNSSRKFCGN